MHCAVFGCNNNNKGINTKFHAFAFPKCAKLRKQWIKFCRRSEFNEQTSVICEAHFKKEDFSNNMQFEMGFAKLRLLNPTACPSIFKEEEITVDASKRNARKQVREQKQVVAELLKEPVPFEEVNVRNAEAIEVTTEICAAEMAEVPVPKHESSAGKIDEVSVAKPDSNEEIIQSLKHQIYILYDEIERLRKENFAQSKHIKKNLLPEISDLKKRLQKAEFKNIYMEQELKNMCTSRQVETTQNDSKRTRWSENELF